MRGGPLSYRPRVPRSACPLLFALLCGCLPNFGLGRSVPPSVRSCALTSLTGRLLTGLFLSSALVVIWWFFLFCASVRVALWCGFLLGGLFLFSLVCWFIYFLVSSECVSRPAVRWGVCLQFRYEVFVRGVFSLTVVWVCCTSYAVGAPPPHAGVDYAFCQVLIFAHYCCVSFTWS